MVSHAKASGGFVFLFSLCENRKNDLADACPTVLSPVPPLLNDMPFYRPFPTRNGRELRSTYLESAERTPSPSSLSSLSGEDTPRLPYTVPLTVVLALSSFLPGLQRAPWVRRWLASAWVLLCFLSETCISVRRGGITPPRERRACVALLHRVHRTATPLPVGPLLASAVGRTDPPPRRRRWSSRRKT